MNLGGLVRGTKIAKTLMALDEAIKREDLAGVALHARRALVKAEGMKGPAAVELRKKLRTLLDSAERFAFNDIAKREANVAGGG